MEKSLARYIWVHTRPQQLFILLIVALSMIPYYLAFDLPKQIVNGPIQGTGFEQPGNTQLFMPIAFDLPFFGHVELFAGLPLERMPSLLALSLTFLVLVIINGLFKYFINTYKGRLGERLLRRIRYELVDRILRFPPRYFKHIKAGEVSSMVKDEVEPLGGFTADAFVQPALLGGQALTALIFIFIQHFWLGFIAFAMAMIQVGIIPRMRRRLIELGRERQLTARQLAGRVAEIVDGIDTIHAYDTSNYERADIAARLGRIFKIRYDIYQWKFLVKFLNNFLAQLTPFLFYCIGGYLTIVGKLDVGQLVAVINAYKELPGPLKELIDWELVRQDVQVKYEQVVEQFEADEMIAPEIQAIDAGNGTVLNQPLSTVNLLIDDDIGGRVLEHVTVKIAPGETVAIIGTAASGGDRLAEALARVVWPAGGKVTVGEDDLFALPEAVTGRRISYVSPEAYFFHGSLKDNLLYGLKHAPIEPAAYKGQAADQRKWDVLEARRSGKGAFLDFSQREVASFTLGEEILAASADPQHRLAPRGNDEAGIAQQDAYRCADGKWLAVTLRQADPSMAGFCAKHDRDAALVQLLNKGIAAAPCLDGDDLLRDTALQGVTLIRDERGQLVKGLPYRLDGKGVTIERAAPDLGQHTDAVLRELLGYDEARLKQLKESGVTSTTPTIGDV